MALSPLLPIIARCRIERLSSGAICPNEARLERQSWIGGPASLTARPPPGPADLPEPLPSDLAGLVELQIASLLSGRAPPVDLIAESLGTSRRSLQRGLAQQGISYTDLLTKVRLRRAAEWLERSEKPVVEIAFDLGYADASNFTRAFRQLTGVPPSAFRQAAVRN